MSLTMGSPDVIKNEEDSWTMDMYSSEYSHHVGLYAPVNSELQDRHHGNVKGDHWPTDQNVPKQQNYLVISLKTTI